MQVDIDTLDTDAPIFAPQAFRLSDWEADLIAKARHFGRRICGRVYGDRNRDSHYNLVLQGEK